MSLVCCVVNAELFIGKLSQIQFCQIVVDGVNSKHQSCFNAARQVSSHPVVIMFSCNYAREDNAVFLHLHNVHSASHSALGICLFIAIRESPKLN